LLEAASTSVLAGGKGVAETTAGGSRAATDPLVVRVHVHRVGSIRDRVFNRAIRAVDRGMEQVVRHADRALDRPVSREVVAGATAPRDRIVTNTRPAVWDSAADWLGATDRRDPDALHLVLVNAPFQQSIGYGGNRTHLLNPGPVSYANVGATERWDDALVTDNIAVHEVLHGILTPREVSAVVDSRCEHDLGAVIPAEQNGAIATPLATAYAETSVGGETQWPGSGCTGGFSRDVRYDPDWWGHTYALSSATLDATARYLDRF
jgi:hypothetical protein